MEIHHTIEPDRLNQLHLNYASPIYRVYHKHLCHQTKVEAAESTRKFIQSSTFSLFEDQLAAIEFLYMNDYLTDVEVQLSQGGYDQDITKLYRIIVDRKKIPLTSKETRDIESFEFTHPSLQVLHLFLLVYAHNDMKKYGSMDKYMDVILESLLKINEPLFHYYMKLRFDELTFQHYWKTNNILLAKKFAYKFINAGLSPKKQAAMNHHLALCHVFEDYHTAMSYVDKSLEITKQYELNRYKQILLNNTAPFIAAFHEKAENIHTTDLVEKAHVAIANNDRSTGIRILSSLGSLTPFQESYLGLAKRDLTMLENAKRRFIHDNGDLFFAQLPEHYMKRV